MAVEIHTRRVLWAAAGSVPMGEQIADAIDSSATLSTVARETIRNGIGSASADGQTVGTTGVIGAIENDTGLNAFELNTLSTWLGNDTAVADIAAELG